MNEIGLALAKIVSGGQTGVDRGALDTALDNGFPCGGWCPSGRLAEDGRIPDRYPVTELTGGSYRQRTLRNVVDICFALSPHHRGATINTPLGQKLSYDQRKIFFS